MGELASHTLDGQTCFQTVIRIASWSFDADIPNRRHCMSTHHGERSNDIEEDGWKWESGIRCISLLTDIFRLDLSCLKVRRFLPATEPISIDIEGYRAISPREGTIRVNFGGFQVVSVICCRGAGKIYVWI